MGRRGKVRGRPAVTRARVLRYWAQHGPCPIMQVCRALGAERSHVKRILKKFAPLEFCPMAELKKAA